MRVGGFPSPDDFGVPVDSLVLKLSGPFFGSYSIDSASCGAPFSAKKEENAREVVRAVWEVESRYPLPRNRRHSLAKEPRCLNCGGRGGPAKIRFLGRTKVEAMSKHENISLEGLCRQLFLHSCVESKD